MNNLKLRSNVTFKSLTTSLCLLCVLILSACNSRLNKQSGGFEGADDIETQDFSSPDYAMLMKKVLQPKCVECHSTAGGNRGGVNVETYSGVRRALNAIQSSVQDGSMPKNRAALTAKQRHLLLKWIAEGGPEKAQITGQADSPQSLTPLKIDYATVNQQVIDGACLTCHNSANSKGEVNLESYALVTKNLNKVKKAIEDGSMPKKGQLSDLQRGLLVAWLNLGAPETSHEMFSPSAKISSLPNQEGALVTRSPEEEFIARGKYLFNLASCSACHTLDPEKPLAGGLVMPTPFGDMHVPNISPDLETGIGHWTAAQFLRALREGISPKNEYYYPAFPFTNYSKMTDEDILSIRAYLLTQKPVRQVNRSTNLQFPYNQRELLPFWRLLYFPIVERMTLANFAIAQGPLRAIASLSLQWNRGAYLVEGPLHCAQCHSPRDEHMGLKVNQWMSGSTVSGGDLPAPNITPDPQTGTGHWTTEDWRRLLREGVTPRGEKVGGEMWKVIRHATSELTSTDQSAVIAYMLALRPIRNEALATKIQQARTRGH